MRHPACRLHLPRQRRSSNCSGSEDTRCEGFEDKQCEEGSEDTRHASSEYTRWEDSEDTRYAGSVGYKGRRKFESFLQEIIRGFVSTRRC